MRALHLSMGIALAAVCVSPASAQSPSPCALPYQITNGQPADASQVMANFNALLACVNNAVPAGSNNAVQFNNGNGQFGAVGPLSDGQVVIGASGAAPQAKTLTAGSGITITNSAGNITIATNGSGGGGSGLYGQVMSPTPTLASTGLSTWLNQGSATTADTPVGLAMTMPANAGNGLTARYAAAPTPPYTLTALIAVARSSTGNSGVGIGWYDGTNKLHILNYLSNGQNPQITVEEWNSPTSFSTFDVRSGAGLGQPVWLQLHDDGTTATFAYSYDGVSYLPIYSVAKSSGFLGAAGYSNLIFFFSPSTADPLTVGTVLSWEQS